MTVFLRLSADKDKAQSLAHVSMMLRKGEAEPRIFHVAPEAFRAVPGVPFAYWVSDSVRGLFQQLPCFEADDRSVEVGLQTSDDARFVRLWFEVIEYANRWLNFSKGGSHSQFYSDVHLVVNAERNFNEIVSFQNARYPYLKGNARSFLHADISNFQRIGLTWPLRAKSFAPRALPLECVFSIRGYAAFTNSGDELASLAIFNSCAFDYLFKIALGRFGFPEFLVGVLQVLPWAEPSDEISLLLSSLARRAWSLKRSLDTGVETSHAYLLPPALRARLGCFDPRDVELQLERILSEIDAIAFDLYKFSDNDRLAATSHNLIDEQGESEVSEEDEETSESELSAIETLLSWSVGVVFGRFDWRLATSERAAPPEPDPFDPLPSKSPGMLPDGAAPFHTSAGILVDDQGNPHDLAHLVEEVLGRVEMPVPNDVRRWLQRDFFAFHLQRYSKSRRKAPIYWPLSTVSGSYTVWLYYPSLSSQTLYTAINDFVEPKLKEVGAGGTALRNKGTARTRDEEKQFETLQAFELELTELRDTLLGIAQGYQPNHDDGVQITAAPLWPLFRHKPWQKVLNDTWAKLEKGGYDWAHLAMNYWPARVREKCKTDKSLAIAHELEELYVEPAVKPKKTRGQSKKS